MKAAVLHASRNLRVEDVAIPSPKAGEARIQVAFSGVCGSDMPRVLGNGARSYPLILGHEFSGIVDCVGMGVTGWNPGDTVSAAPLIPCMHCPDCQEGAYSQCKHYSFIGSRVNGSWAEYLCVPAKNLVRLPDHIDLLAGAFMEPLTVGIHGLWLMNFIPFAQTVIIGMGTIGMLTLQAAMGMGATNITVMDLDSDKLEIALQLGANHAINSGDEDAVQQILDITGGRGASQVLETAGVPEAELLALECARSHGKVMYIGTPSRAFTIHPAQFEILNRKELIVQGSWMSYSAPFPGEEWATAAVWLGDGTVRVQPLLDRIIKLESLWDAFIDVEKRFVKGKIMLEVLQ